MRFFIKWGFIKYFKHQQRTTVNQTGKNDHKLVDSVLIYNICVQALLKKSQLEQKKRAEVERLKEARSCQLVTLLTCPFCWLAKCYHCFLATGGH